MVGDLVSGVAPAERTEDLLWGGREGQVNVGDVAAGTCADFLSAFPCALSPLATQRVHFPLVRPPSPPPPFSDDSTRLSRILGMAFPAAAESELSHFTDRTVVRVVLSLRA